MDSEPKIIYITHDFTPTDEAHADLVKIIYPDGRVVFGVPKDKIQTSNQVLIGVTHEQSG